MLPPMKAQTPLSVSKALLRLLSSVQPRPKPFYLEVTPEPWATPLDCSRNVDEIIQRQGGTKQMGWLIHVWPRVLVELQDHAIWIQENGQPRDPTPALPHHTDASPETVQLFLPDPTRTTLEPDSANIQLPYPDHPANKHLANARMAFNQAHQKSDEAEMHKLASEIMRLERQRSWAPDRNDPCPCGARLKYKSCHGK